MGVDDNGKAFTVSPDPLLYKLQERFAGIKFGDYVDVHTVLQSILHYGNIRNVDLYKVGIGEKIEGYFNEMIISEKAVKAV